MGWMDRPEAGSSIGYHESCVRLLPLTALQASLSQSRGPRTRSRIGSGAAALGRCGSAVRTAGEQGATAHLRVDVVPGQQEQDRRLGLRQVGPLRPLEWLLRAVTLAAVWPWR